MSNAKLEALYQAIPTFQCRPGCTDCCGPVAFSKPEWQAIKIKRAGAPGCLSCAYSENGGCTIYQNRPFVCRLFGATEDPGLQCPHGCKPAKPLNRQQTAILHARYQKLVGGNVAGWSIDVSHVGALGTAGPSKMSPLEAMARHLASS